MCVTVQHTLPEFWRRCLIVNLFNHEALDVLLMPLSIENNIHSAKQTQRNFIYTLFQPQSYPCIICLSALPSRPLHIWHEILNFIEPHLWKRKLWHSNIPGYVLEGVTVVRCSRLWTVQFPPVLALTVAGKVCSLWRPGPAGTGIQMPFG